MHVIIICRNGVVYLCFQQLNLLSLCSTGKTVDLGYLKGLKGVTAVVGEQKKLSPDLVSFGASDNVRPT